MRFLIAIFLCCLLVVIGCHSSKPLGELGETPAPNRASVSDSSATAGENVNDSPQVGSGITGAEPELTDTDDKVAVDDAAAASPAQPSQSLFQWGNRNPTDYGWNEEALQRVSVFESLLLTDLAAARAAMTEVAEIRFGKHPLADEWSELSFRLFRDGKVNVLEIKRWLELEVQLLTAVDAETHAKAIQEHQVSLTQINLLVQLMKSQGDDPASIELEFKPQAGPSTEGD